MTSLLTCAKPCGSHLVQYVSHEERDFDGSAWPFRVMFRCPECDREPWKVLLSQADADMLDAELNRAEEDLLVALSRMQLARFENEIEAFVTALAAGHVLPGDIARVTA